MAATRVTVNSNSRQQQQPEDCPDNWSSYASCACNCALLTAARVCALQGILAGCWIVSTDWVTACLQAGGQLLPEEQYEVQGHDGNSSSGCGSNGSSSGGKALPGPAKGRQHKAEGREPLLSGWQVFVLGSGAVKESCTGLVKAAGGSVVARLPPAPFASQQQAQTQQQDANAIGGKADEAGESKSDRKLLVLLPEAAAGSNGGSGGGGGSSKGQLAHAQALGVPVLGQKWLMDSVSQMQLLPMDAFRL